MAVSTKRILLDGQMLALRGVNSGRAPSLVPPNQLSWASNVTVRGGFPETRPRFTKKSLTFTSAEVEAWFKTHIMQGGITYYSDLGTSFIVVSVGGRQFTINPLLDYTVNEITPTAAAETTVNFNTPAIDANVAVTVDDATLIPIGYPLYIAGDTYILISVAGNVLTVQSKTATPATLINSGASVTYLDPNTPSLPLVWMEQAEQYLIIQDGQARAIIYDGAIAHRSDAASNEVPTGTVMVFNEEIGRLCVAVAGNQIQVGDVVGGPTSVIMFTETDYLAEGGAFRVPRKFGKITGMAMMANLDRSNGQGPWVVFAERGMTTFNLPPRRILWKDLTYPPQINMPLPSATSNAGIVAVNGDLYYRGKDGVRSFIYGIREFRGVGNTPISTELDRVITKDTPSLLQHAKAILFDNRYLFTVNPAPSLNGVYHRGLGVLDFHLISSMDQKEPPAYDGIWTGLYITEMVTGTYGGDERAFIFALNPENWENELWELHRETGFDNGTNRIAGYTESRSMIFGDPMTLKELDDLNVWVDHVVGPVTFTAEWRPDSSPCWYDYGTQDVCVKFEDCTEEDCKPLQALNAGYKTRIPFGQPPQVEDGLDGKPARRGYEFQFRLRWQGQARIRKVLAKTRVVEEEVYTPIATT